MATIAPYDTAATVIKAKRRRLFFRLSSLVGLIYFVYQAWTLHHSHAGWLPITSAVASAVLSSMWLLIGSKA